MSDFDAAYPNAARKMRQPPGFGRRNRFLGPRSGRRRHCAVGEVCFNTSFTGYQEIMTDPSYAGQIITFTFPHIGNVGTNEEDIETTMPAARGCVLRADITDPLIGVPCGIAMSGFAAMAYPALPASTRANSRGVSAISVRPTPRYAMPQTVNSIFRRYRRRRPIGPV